MKYKSTQPRFSGYHNGEVVGILKQKSFLGVKYWVHHDTIKNAGQVDEVVFYLNNPDVMTQRLKSDAKQLFSK